MLQMEKIEKINFADDIQNWFNLNMKIEIKKLKNSKHGLTTENSFLKNKIPTIQQS